MHLADHLQMLLCSNKFDDSIPFGYLEIELNATYKSLDLAHANMHADAHKRYSHNLNFAEAKAC